MSEHAEEGHEHHAEHEHAAHESAAEGRVTAPMQEFSTGQVGVGLVVLVVGLLLTFGLAFGLVGI